MRNGLHAARHAHVPPSWDFRELVVTRTSKPSKVAQTADFWNAKVAGLER